MRTSHHQHRYHLHGIRVILVGISLIALCVVRVDATSLTQNSQAEVLAYATNINRSDLLAGTNAARAQNGLAPLTLNSQLNTSAQNKGQHMIANNYWAHVAPDGTQPWYFFDQAGYSYTRAGENLAYGFDSSSATISAWMNSPSHRDNILGDYKDIGFGIANGESYQGNQNTVVVAHYGKQVAAPAPAPVQSQAAPTAPATPPASTPQASPTPEAAPTPTADTPAPDTTTPPSEEAPAATPTPAAATKPQTNTKQVQTSKAGSITLFQALRNGSTPMYGFVSLGLLMASMGGFVVTHRALFNHALATSETYVMKHPMVDFAAIGMVTMLILTTTVSRI